MVLFVQALPQPEAVVVLESVLVAAAADSLLSVPLVGILVGCC